MTKRVREGSLLIAVIGEEDLVTGLLLTGLGNMDNSHNTNYFIVDSKTTQDQVAEAFHKFTTRPDIGILIITQHIAEMIRETIEDFSSPLPAILEVPGKEKEYDSSKDAILRRAQRLCSVRAER
ncbi:putative vacuolar ATP synthase subunit f [Monocercomonoides exilis]|uniref:putative vacuolar ATP synthase subunit f n=1 Tax=Monocercomonoides exilis TaxID=2049356 RepID=UPI003559CDD3|nr:putative vacuolar ATP synthase subunit f [Monocercomonoides exilis]KAH7826772.1 putative vacuolar ATP synthase subunit f [Monocercomonoides exilis]|eukprot:MONOS_4155.1-p1 / transcript=MONOS_4155.1 / gene=MONOS_4155 / organism=Monocercomonoides_exilis_PA203 / gene_product=vacuolar ATP synthase subunit f, putative / transcript_product=vacuolar ATP synthase subunit f, putative / location=Mono_scaffold00106:98998-99668(-) / protein_length=123 / sequence_SO=supercontig / SO=protein_coding / is_pseudo=false